MHSNWNEIKIATMRVGVIVHPYITSCFCKLMEKAISPECILVETLSGHGISASTNLSKLSVAWLLGKMIMDN